MEGGELEVYLLCLTDVTDSFDALAKKRAIEQSTEFLFSSKHRWKLGGRREAVCITRGRM